MRPDFASGPFLGGASDDRWLPNAAGRAKPLEGFASGRDIFGVRVSHAGTKAFILVYRFNGRPRRMTLGRYPTITLSEARKLASEALHSIAYGTDPGAEKIRAKRVPEILHFAPFVDHFIDTYARPKNRSADETARLLKREFVRVWGNRPFKEITRHDVTSAPHAGERPDTEWVSADGPVLPCHGSFAGTMAE